MAGSRAVISMVCLIAAALSADCFAQHPIPESERWATITYPGNEPYLLDVGTGTPRPLGRVDYEYQISRTEVTGGEWLEFVNAYAPYVEPIWADNGQFTSAWINLNYTTGEYVLSPNGQNRPIRDVGWHFAARYVNWLNNGKALTAEAFENGAYDASTFVMIPQGGQPITDQVNHNPDARYWIPTQDEWVKASHFDPNRYGPGQPGYWTYSTSSEESPIPGPPELGGQTSSGYPWSQGEYPIPEVAGYRDVMSPWGLWDVSGGASEWTESPAWEFPDSGFVRMVEGSELLANPMFFDRIDFVSSDRATGSHGFRVARAVPGPVSAGVLLCVFTLKLRRKRNADGTPASHRYLRDPVALHVRNQRVRRAD